LKEYPAINTSWRPRLELLFQALSFGLFVAVLKPTFEFFQPHQLHFPGHDSRVLENQKAIQSSLGMLK